ncbi:MAG: hypothetical protein R3C53_09230 [Pirellulaceae bacterium]
MVTASEIESIVRLVVQRLRESTSASAVNARLDAVPTEILRLDEQLVTLEQLRDRLAGVRCVEVLRRAVVTPAVVDELRQRGIRLQRIDITATRVEPHDLLILAPASKHTRQLDEYKLLAADDTAMGLTQLTSHLTEAVCANAKSSAIWCSGQPYQALLATKTSPSLRAVLLPNMAELRRAVAEAAPNVLIVDDRWSSLQLVGLARSLRTGTQEFKREST